MQAGKAQSVLLRSAPNSGTKLATPLAQFRSVIDRYGLYRTSPVGSDLLLERMSDYADLGPSSRLATVITDPADAIQCMKLIASIEQYRSNKQYSDPHEHHPARIAFRSIASDSSIKDRLTDLSPKSWELLSRIVSRVPPTELFDAINELVLPAYFRWKPNGAVRVFVHNPKYEHPLSLLRTLRVASAFHVDTFFPDVPSSLSTWQLTNHTRFFDLLMDWCGLLTFPKIASMSMNQFGISFVFTADDHLSEYSPNPYPLSLLEPTWSQSRFGKPHSGLRILEESMEIPAQTYNDRHCWTNAIDHFGTLLDFISDRASRLVFDCCDLVSFGRGDSHVIDDYCEPQEQFWTIERIARRTVQIQSAEARYVDPLVVFEVADCWAEIFKSWKGGKSGDNFQSLFSRKFAVNVLIPCFSKLPPPWNVRFTSEATAVYGGLIKSIKDSVWARRKMSDVGVDMAFSPNQTSIEDWDLFCSALIRALRNTHHGYVPDRDQDRVRRRLMLTTGDIGWEITYLPSLWLLAFLCDPRRFAGWPNHPT